MEPFETSIQAITHFRTWINTACGLHIPENLLNATVTRQFMERIEDELPDVFKEWKMSPAFARAIQEWKTGENHGKL